MSMAGAASVDLPGGRMLPPSWSAILFSLDSQIENLIQPRACGGSPGLGGILYASGSWRRTHMHLSGAFALTVNKFNM